MGDVVAHSNAGAVALRNIIDEKVGESGMSIDCLSSNGSQQHVAETRKMHFWDIEGRVEVWI